MTRRPDGLRWLGHSSAVLDLDGVRLLADPVLRRRPGILRRHAPDVDEAHVAGADAVLVTHLHRDHLDLPSLRRLRGARFVVPAGAGGLLRAGRLPDVVELPVGARLTVGGGEVEAVPADHDGRRLPLPFSRRAQAVGFLVRGAGTSVLVAGDTALHPQMRALAGRVGVALLPVGGWGLTLGPGHMDPEQAAQALLRMQPRVALPVHWGTLRPLGLGRVRRDLMTLPGERFRGAAALVAPDVHVAVLAPGQALDPALLGGA